MKKYLDQLLIQKIVVCFLLFLLCSVKAVNRSDAEDMPPDDSPSFSENLNIPSDTTIIEDYAFYNCSSLTGCLALPSSVKSIGQYAFYYCIGLTLTSLPSGITRICQNAFQNCIRVSYETPYHALYVFLYLENQVTALSFLYRKNMSHRKGYHCP